jgi:pimeloyl-ACP methyl ester carboxylesterase
MPWKQLLLTLLLVYLAFSAFLFVMQRRLLYQPFGGGISPQRAAELGLRHWPSVEDFRGFVPFDEQPAPRGTVVVFHGNAGAAFHRGFYFPALSRHHLRVVLAEYPGYGGRPGRPSESTLVADALETIALAQRMYGEPLYLWGESLGAGVAAGAIAQTDVPIAGLVLFTPWDSLPAVAQTHYPYLPVRWLVLDRYQTVDNLDAFAGRIAVILAGMDEVIPVKHGQNLYDSLPGNKQLWLFEGARHNSMPIEADQDWWGQVVGFLDPAHRSE